MTIENFLSRQTLATTLASAVSGAGLAYAKNFAIKDAVIISTATGLAASAATSILDPEGSTVLKVIVTAAAIFGTLMALQSSAKFLQSKLGLVIDPKLMSYLTFANFVGQVLSFMVSRGQPTLTLKALDDMKKESIEVLHAKLKAEGTEAFDKMGTILHIRVAQRFEEFKLEKVKDAPELTVELIKGLSADEVSYLFSHTWTDWVKTEPLKHALMLRFLECGLYDSSITKGDLENLLKEFKLPATVEDITKLSDQGRAFCVSVYKEAKAQWKALPLAAQWALVASKLEDLLPTYDAARIKDAPKEVVQWILSTKNWLEFSREEQDALKAKCTEFEIEHTSPCHPQDVSDVTALSEAQVKTYFPMFENVTSVAQLKDAAVTALLGRFCTLELDPKTIPVEVFTPTRISALPQINCAQDARDLTDKLVPWVHRSYSGSLETWYREQDKARQPVLNERFQKAGLSELFIIKSKEALPGGLNAKLHHAAFKRDPEAWKKFYISQQRAFNDLFVAEGLSQLDVTSTAIWGFAG